MPRVRHIGLLRFKVGCTPEDEALVWRTLRALRDKIPGILEFSGGPDISTEGRAEGITHSFIMTFDSVEARDRYLPHPIHLEAVEIVLPRLERIIVVDHVD